MYILGAFGSIIRQELIIHKIEKKEKKCFVSTSATAYADVFLLHYTIPSIFI